VVGVVGGRAGHERGVPGGAVSEGYMCMAQDAQHTACCLLLASCFLPPASCFLLPGVRCMCRACSRYVAAMYVHLIKLGGCLWHQAVALGRELHAFSMVAPKAGMW
jgi:hypothetical protein